MQNAYQVHKLWNLLYVPRINKRILAAQNKSHAVIYVTKVLVLFVDSKDICCHFLNTQ